MSKYNLVFCWLSTAILVAAIGGPSAYYAGRAAGEESMREAAVSHDVARYEFDGTHKEAKFKWINIGKLQFERDEAVKQVGRLLGLLGRRQQPAVDLPPQ